MTTCAKSVDDEIPEEAKVIMRELGIDRRRGILISGYKKGTLRCLFSGNLFSARDAETLVEGSTRPLVATSRRLPV